MGLPKGMTNNKAGRPKGSTNKITGKLRESITKFVEDNFDEVVIIWKQMDPKDKLRFYRDMIQYVVPKLQSSDINDIDVEVKDVLDTSIMTTGELIKRAEALRKIKGKE